MKTTLSAVFVLGALGLSAATLIGCRPASPPKAATTPAETVSAVSSPGDQKDHELSSPPMRQVIQQRREESGKLSPAVKQAVREFERSAAKAEKQLDALPPKRTPDAKRPAIDLAEAAQHAAGVWEAAHPKAPAGPGKRLDVTRYRQQNSDDCGSTAVRSVVHFHKKTDPGIEACRRAVFTDFVAALPGGKIIGKVTGLRGFTMPSGIKLGVEREFKMACAERRKCSPDDLRRAVNEERPAIVLVRSGDSLLHWLVITGYSGDDFIVMDPGDGQQLSLPESLLIGSWNLDASYQNGQRFGELPGVLKGHRRVTLVIGDAGPDDAGTAEFVVEQIVLLGMDALRRGANPKLIGDALDIVANAVGAHTDLGKAIKAAGNLARAVADGKGHLEVAKLSVGVIDGLLREVGILPKDSQLAKKAERALEIADKIDQLFKKGLKGEAKKLIEEFTGISKEFTGILGGPAKQLGLDGAMVPALGVLEAGLKIADICRRWGELSDLGKVAAVLDGLSSAAMAAQAFCSVAVCEVKGPIILLAMLLKDLINLGIDLGLDGPNFGGSRKKPDGGSGPDGKPEENKKEEPKESGSEPSAAGSAAKQAADRGATPGQIGKAVAEAVNDPSVEQPAARAAAEAKEKGEDVATAVERVEEVKQASERQQREDAKTAKEAVAKAKKPNDPTALAEAVVQSRRELAPNKKGLQELIAAESKPGRDPESVVRRALTRLRVQKALTGQPVGPPK